MEWVRDLLVGDEQDRDVLVQDLARGMRNLRRRYGSRGPAGPVLTARRAVSSLERIIAIVDQARRCGRVRWFSPDIRPTGRVRGPHAGDLRILNAAEVVPGRPPRVQRPAETLCLLLGWVTPHNRRALVTVVEPTHGAQNGVIVWSDSTGERFADPWAASWTTKGLMTAPHHGSVDPGHQMIWKARATKAPDTVVLLSNNSWGTTTTYLSLCGQHACTHCDCPGGSKHPGKDAVAHWCGQCSGWRLAEL